MSIQSNINQMLNTIAIGSIGIGHNLGIHDKYVANKQKEKILSERMETGDFDIYDTEKSPKPEFEKYFQYQEDKLEKGTPISKSMVEELKQGTPEQLAQKYASQWAEIQKRTRQMEITSQREATMQTLLKARANIERYEKGGN